MDTTRTATVRIHAQAHLSAGMAELELQFHRA
jgi:hypothetical protein